MKLGRYIFIVLAGAGIYSLLLSFIAPLRTVYAQTPSFAPMLFYQANPKTYSWKVNGITYTNNKNPFGVETYGCTGNTTEDTTAKDSCIPTAKTISGIKFWNPNTTYTEQQTNTCSVAQGGSDGPPQTMDTRKLNGTTSTNANLPICTSTPGTRANYPFLTVTKTFTYDSSYCADGNSLVLAPRSDPGNPVCQNIYSYDMLLHSSDYTQDQRNCMFFADDAVGVQACKDGVCNRDSFSTAAVAQGFGHPPWIYNPDVCDLFTQGDGAYTVTVDGHDVYQNIYGSSSLWLTSMSAGIPHTITGHVFNDINKDGNQDTGEPTYPGPITITSSAGTVTTSGGSYTISNIPDGSVTVSFTSLPANYQMSYPKNGPPPFFVATVGPGCSVDTTTRGQCDAGDISHLNFAITNSIPWFQSSCGDIRNDNGITDYLPLAKLALTTNATCPTSPLAFNGDTDPNFGQGQASATNQTVGGSTYPEVFSPSSTLDTAYSSLLAKTQNASLTPTNLATVCSLTNCTLPANLAHGIYLANSDVALNAYNFLLNNDYVFLINGNLTIKGNITVPVGSTALFSTTKNITVASTVGSAADVTTSNLDGWYIAGQSFIVNSQGNCNDLRLNIAGSVVMNALGNGGIFQNNRDLCGSDPVDPTVSFTQRLDMILNAPQFLRQQQTISQEIAP